MFYGQCWKCGERWSLGTASTCTCEPEQPQQNEFNPDWDAMAVMVEEQQRMAKRIEELEAQLKRVTLEDVYLTIIQWDVGGGKRSRRELARRIVAKYTTPPQRTWVGLTDEEREEIALEVPMDAVLITEAKLKELNT